MQRRIDHQKVGSESDVEEDNEQTRSPNWANYDERHQNDGEEESCSDDDEDDDEDSLNVENQRQGDVEDSSEEEDEDCNHYPLQNNGIHTVREDSQENSDSDGSIDHIEQRIKKLERDLEGRLNKHSANIKNMPSKTAGKIVPKSKISNPPIPTKTVKTTQQQHNDNENKMNSVNQVKRIQQNITLQVQQKMKQKRKQKQKERQNKKEKETNNIEQIVSKQQQIKYIPKQQQPVPGVPMKKNKTNVSKKNINEQKNGESSVSVKDNALAKKMKVMEDKMNQLKNQNLKLKEELKMEKFKVCKKNQKKPLQELQKLKQISSNNSKLQKQLQLLEVLEKLQAKLRKSINKKLAKGTKSEAATTLLHKGHPASYASHI